MSSIAHASFWPLKTERMPAKYLIDELLFAPASIAESHTKSVVPLLVES